MLFVLVFITYCTAYEVNFTVLIKFNSLPRRVAFFLKVRSWFQISLWHLNWSNFLFFQLRSCRDTMNASNLLAERAMFYSRLSFTLASIKLRFCLRLRCFLLKSEVIHTWNNCNISFIIALLPMLLNTIVSCKVVFSAISLPFDVSVIPHILTLLQNLA